MIGALCLTGCKSYPPEINNGRFVYPKYQISFAVPPPDLWQSSKKLPDRFIPKVDERRSMIGAFNKAVFLNDKQDSAIALEVSKMFINAAKLPPQQIKVQLEKSFLSFVKNMETSLFFSDYKYDFSVPYINKTPLLLSTETFNMNSCGKTYRCEIHTYIYIINDDDTCKLRFILWSAPETYSKNKAVLNQLLGTLRRELGN
ncbi:MAG: hypothetical protein WC959_03680 [Kiritimatiellales bacterium]